MKLFNIRELYKEKYREYKDAKISLIKEQAVYMNPDEVFTFTAQSNCKYIVAGTHTTPHGH